MISMWKWILRPIVIAIAGGGGVKACEDSPLFGMIFILLSLAGAIWLIRDIYLAGGFHYVHSFLQTVGVF
jgi:hypothetical protein